ncbi:MAG: ADOP family duplicated permease [Gemmatimonadota bacterium]
MPNEESAAHTLRDRLQQSVGSAYTIERQLSGGGMSAVFVAMDTAFNRRIVIKVLPRELADDDSLDRFRREIALVAALQHPQIVPVFGAGEVDGLPYYVMPFVDGESLRKRLARGPLSLRETISTLVDVSRALAYAHEHGMVHRDIKPDNILLTTTSAVVTDFGVAKAIISTKHRKLPAAAVTPSGGATTEGMSLGTPAYMAPEQVVGDPNVDHRADLYALGLVAYEMLVGTSPFAGLPPHQQLSAQITEMPQPLSARRADIPPGLERLVMQCLSKAPDKRPRSALEIMRALQDPETIATASRPARRETARMGVARRARIGLVSLVRDDLQGAARGLIRSPMVSLSAILCLAVGIGVTAAVFSAVDRALLRALPFVDPNQLVTIYRTTPQFGAGPFAPANYVDLSRATRTIESMAAASVSSGLIASGETTVQVPAARVTGNVFSLLGVVPVRGRLLTSVDEAANENPVVVLSEEIWRRLFSGDSSLISRSILVDGQPATVIGILPAGFRIPHGFQVLRADIWMPLRFSPEALSQRRNNYLLSFGRLSPGNTAAAAQSELVRIFDGIVTAHPELNGESVQVLPLQAEGVANVRTPLLQLLAAVLMVLLIAATNVASLLLARGVQLRREFAIRAALGASRWDIVRPVLAESVLLAVVGAALGLGLAWAAVRSIGTLAAQRIPQLAGLGVDWRVIGFGFGVAVFAAVLCAILPAMRSTQSDPQDALRSGRGGGADRAQHRALGTLVVAEGALSLVLLVSAGLVLRGLLRLTQNDPGFAVERLLTLEAHVSPTTYADGNGVRRFLEPAIAALETLPGVERAAGISLLPYRAWGWNFNARYEGQPGDNPTRLPIVELRTITPGFFDVSGQRLLRGRALGDGDDLATEQSARVVVVNEALAKRDFPGQDPIGKRVHWGDGFATIVGIVSDIRNAGPISAPRPEMYWSYRQRDVGATVFNIVVRVRSGDPNQLASSVQQSLRAIEPGVAIGRVMPMRAVVAASLGQPRFLASMIAVFAGVALLLAIAGLYGVLSYAVAQRSRELGIRSALGSSARDLMWLIARRAALLVAAAIVVGLGASAAVTRLLQATLYGVSAFDVPTWGVATVGLVVAATLATLIPAIRATRADPIVAMRAE